MRPGANACSAMARMHAMVVHPTAFIAQGTNFGPAFLAAWGRSEYGGEGRHRCSSSR